MHALVDGGESVLLEVGGVALHLDGGEPLLHRLALQGTLGGRATTALLASARLWLGSGGGEGGKEIDSIDTVVIHTV